MGREKLQKYIFILLLILLPAQLGYHFWPEWSYVSGIRIDYFSPTLYVTDLLILLLFLLEIPKFKFLISKKFLIIIPLIILNTYFSLSPAVSAYKWLKIGEIAFLAWFIAKRAQFEVKWLLVPVAYEAVLAIGQFWAQGSLGGVWYWLGERMFSGTTPGIANAIINGQLLLRPYGTFSHPNVLGGFLAVALSLILARFPRNSRKLTVVVVLLGYVALFLSMSRVTIVVGVVASLWVLKKRLLWLLVPLLLVAPRFLTIETESIAARQVLNTVALTEWQKMPVWGTGLGTASLYGAKVANYALAFQPTHNIYLLILAETGILGGLATFFLLRRVRWGFLMVAVAVLGLFDHYLLTLQQGQLLLALVLGLNSVTMRAAKAGKVVRTNDEL